MHIVLTVNTIHAPGIKEDQQHEDVNRALLCKPETQLKSTHTNSVQLLDEQHSEPVGAKKPDHESDANEAKVGAPVGQAFVSIHE